MWALSVMVLRTRVCRKMALVGSVSPGSCCAFRRAGSTGADPLPSVLAPFGGQIESKNIIFYLSIDCVCMYVLQSHSIYLPQCLWTEEETGEKIIIVNFVLITYTHWCPWNLCRGSVELPVLGMSGIPHSNAFVSVHWWTVCRFCLRHAENCTSESSSVSLFFCPLAARFSLGGGVKLRWQAQLVPLFV